MYFPEAEALMKKWQVSISSVAGWTRGKKKLFPGRLGDNHLLLGIVNGSNGLEGGSRAVHEFNGDGASSISASGGPVDDNIN